MMADIWPARRAVISALDELNECSQRADAARLALAKRVNSKARDIAGASAESRRLAARMLAAMERLGKATSARTPGRPMTAAQSARIRKALTYAYGQARLTAGALNPSRYAVEQRFVKTPKRLAEAMLAASTAATDLFDAWNRVAKAHDALRDTPQQQSTIFASAADNAAARRHASMVYNAEMRAKSFARQSPA